MRKAGPLGSAFRIYALPMKTGSRGVQRATRERARRAELVEAQANLALAKLRTLGPAEAKVGHRQDPTK
jgi:hypothetical protein